MPATPPPPRQGLLTLDGLGPVLTLCALQSPPENDDRLRMLPGQVLGGPLQPWGPDTLRTEQGSG